LRWWRARRVIVGWNGILPPHSITFGIDPARPRADQGYHGAVDNGTGCGILLELARLWAGTKPATPRRFVRQLVTAGGTRLRGDPNIWEAY